jgi:hypothetical protein
LPVTNNQLSLTPAYRGHGINCLDPRQHGLGHRLALNHRWRLYLKWSAGISLDWSQSVNRATEWVNNAAQERIAYGHSEHFPGSANCLALFDLG